VVLVIQEIFGMADWVRAVADQLAADGFIAIAPDLLSGKSPGGGDSDSADQQGAVAPVRKLDRSEVNRRLQATAEIGKQPLAYPPGTEWRYSGATNVLGYLVEVLAHQPFEVFLEDRIFRPLGMVDTRFFVPEEESHRVPAAYAVNEEGVTEELWPQPPAQDLRLPSAPRGAGGLFSTANDYLRLSQMLLNGGELDGIRLLGLKTVSLMTTDHLPPGVNLPVQFGRRYRLAGYGFGLGVRVRSDLAESQMLGSLGEYGWGGAHGTYFLIDPEEELAAMFLPQLRGSAFFPIRRQFNNAVYQALVN
jgi:CubicO group peptidase (beta-lactamase class C family)